MLGIRRTSANVLGYDRTSRQNHRSSRRRLLLEPLEERALLSTWTVNSLGDDGTGSGASGDLRYCITQADQTLGDNTINFSVRGTITLNSALPDLSNTTGLIDVESPGASSLTVARNDASGTPDFRIFTVDINVRANLAGLTIAGGLANGNGGGILCTGSLTVTDSIISNNASTHGSGAPAHGGRNGGGGIYNVGTMIVIDSSIINNTATDGTDLSGGGIDNVGTMTVIGSNIDKNLSQYYGGGVGNTGNHCVLTIENSTIADNYSATMGGGILNESTMTLANSAVSGNYLTTPDGDCGGIDNNGGPLTITNSTISNNRAFNGGGMLNNGTVTITNSTISNNSAQYAGGGIYNDDFMTVTNSTIAGNSAVFGGGAFDGYGALTIINSTIAYNKGSQGGGLDIAYGGTAALYNSIVALNTNGGITPNDISIDGETIPNTGTVSSSSEFNLIGTGGSGGLLDGVKANQVGVANPGLAALADNGGPTQTVALVSGSPAVDAGSNSLAVDPSTGQPLSTDQRGTGFKRIMDGFVDIGAFESQFSIAGVTVGWGTQQAALYTASDGRRLQPEGRNIDIPWLGINRVQISLAQAATLNPGDISVIGSSGLNYGPVTLSGSGKSYTITLAQAVNQADRVTLTIRNAVVINFTRRLDVLPGDFNDDGVVNSQDMVGIRNEIIGYAGAVWTIFGDINGDGLVDINDYTAVRTRIGTHL
jgi:hypothetical protein